MADITSSSSTSQTDAEYEAIFTQQLIEIRFLQEQMQRERAEIRPELRIETSVIKAESASLDAEIKLILNRAGLRQVNLD